MLATLPPFLLALAFPALFFSALDFAGCYGVLTLFGLLPVAMAWSERYQVSCVWAGAGGVTFVLPWDVSPVSHTACTAAGQYCAAMGVPPGATG